MHPPAPEWCAARMGTRVALVESHPAGISRHPARVAIVPVRANRRDMHAGSRDAGFIRHPARMSRLPTPVTIVPARGNRQKMHAGSRDAGLICRDTRAGSRVVSVLRRRRSPPPRPARLNFVPLLHARQVDATGSQSSKGAPDAASPVALLVPGRLGGGAPVSYFLSFEAVAAERRTESIVGVSLLLAPACGNSGSSSNPADGGTTVSTSSSSGGAASSGSDSSGSGSSSGDSGPGSSSGSSGTRDATDDLTGAMAISAGGHFACAILSGGTVQCWGATSAGELGNGSTTGPDTCVNGPCSTTPVAVTRLSTGATAVSAGGYFACALLSGGPGEGWGNNVDGTFGNGTTSNSPTPVAASGLTGMTAISASYDFTCGLLTGGTVECWGANTYGQLGNGTTTSSSTPAAVTGLTGVTSIGAGLDFACALLSGGTVQCWGSNGYLQLGNVPGAALGTCSAEVCGGIGCTTERVSCSTTPVALSGLSGVTAISVGYYSACALLSGGTVECWGWNAFGQLGNGTMTNSSIAVPVTGLTGATAISVGYYAACALLSGGTVQCWGSNVEGELGIGTTNGPDNCSDAGSTPCSTTPVMVQ